MVGQPSKPKNSQHEPYTDASTKRAQELFRVLGGQHVGEQAGGSTPLAALQIIGDCQVTKFQLTQSCRASIASESTMRVIANVSGINFRKVRLRSEDR